MMFRSGKRFKGGWGGKPAVRTARGRGWSLAGNLLLLAALWLVGVVVINLGGPQRYAGLAEGQRAPATVVAAVDFDCVNVAATELLRRQAAESVVPVFSIQLGPLQAAWRTLDKLADRAVKLRQEADAAAPKPREGAGGSDEAETSKVLEANLAVAADLLGIPVSGEALAGLFAPGKEWDVLAVLKEELSAVWAQGVLSEAERESGFQGLSLNPAIDILAPSDQDEAAYRTVALGELPSVDMAVEAYVAAVRPRLEALGVEASAKTVADLVRPALRPNLEYDERATDERRLAVRRGIAPVTMTVKAGTTLVEERTTVTAQTVELVSAYHRRMAELESPYDRQMKRLGDSALMLIVLVVCVGWLRTNRPAAYFRTRRKWMLVLLALLALGIAALCHYLAVGLNWLPSWLAPFAIPITLATMLTMLMMGPAAALAMGLWSSLSASLIFDRSFELLLLGLGGSVVAVLLLRNVRKRSQVMRAGLAVGLLEGLMALALAATYQHLPGTFLMQVAGGVASGVLAAILATLLLPLVEWLFQQTTAISLLELTDMGHPLLQRLALEAPGTYHHSLMTAAIGQAAANRIGADGLQVAVCAYFHDIGKLSKPEFFNENQRSGENPHDNLAPSMSALVIQSHVKEGLTLAKRYQLPRLVCDAIRMHHGTALASYFYHVARQALKETGQAEDAGLEHSYRYDGPKPATREMAVLMLADTVEAASRSLDKATPNRIAEMVDTLVRDKLLDGQLDHCPLTLQDLRDIRESFVFSLTNILHGRNPYPREDQPAQPAKSAAPAPGGVPEAAPDVGGEGVPS